MKASTFSIFVEIYVFFLAQVVKDRGVPPQYPHRSVCERDMGEGTLLFFCARFFSSPLCTLFLFEREKIGFFFLAYPNFTCGRSACASPTRIRDPLKLRVPSFFSLERMENVFLLFWRRRLEIPLLEAALIPLRAQPLPE